MVEVKMAASAPGSEHAGYTSKRPILKRQHTPNSTHMNMALVPSPRVDYSVTKGGVRLWAVVFMFIILCGCVYTVFQNTQLAMDMEEFDFNDADDLDTDDEIALTKKKQHEIHHRPKSKQTENPDKDGEVDEQPAHGVRSKALEELMLMELEEKWQRLRGAHKINEKDSRLPIIDLDDDDADDDDDDQEDDDDDQDDDDDDDEPTIPRSGRKPDPVVDDDDDEEDDQQNDEEQDNQEDEEEEEEKPQPKNKRQRRQLIRVSLQKDDKDEKRKNEIIKNIKVKRPPKPVKVAPKSEPEPEEPDEEPESEPEAEEDVTEVKRQKRSAKIIRIKPTDEDVQEDKVVKPTSIRVKRTSRVAKAAKKAIEPDAAYDEESGDKDDGEEQNNDENEEESDEEKKENQQEDDDNDQEDDQDEDDDASTIEKAIQKHSRRPDRPIKPKKNEKKEPKKARFVRIARPKEEEKDDDEDDNEEENQPTTSKTRASRLPTAKRVDVQERIEKYESQDDTLQGTAARLKKAKKGSIAHSPYKKADITSHNDRQIKDELDAAEHLLDVNRVEEAEKAFNAILKQHPDSPRAQYGVARCVDHYAHIAQSNALLEQAIDLYSKVLDNTDTPLSLFEQVAEKAIERCRFRGYFQRALKLHKHINDKLPGSVEQLNSFGVTYLMMNDYTNAKKIFKTVLLRDKENGYALVHYGFCLKVGDRNLEEGYKFLKAGIDTGEPGTQDARFFYHMGDAMQRLGLVKQNPYAPPSTGSSGKRRA